MYEIKEQKLDNLIDKFNTCMNAILYKNKSKLEIVLNSIVFKEPTILYEDKMKKTNHLIEKLEILNPLSALKRGYSIVKKDNKCISNINDINKDDMLDVTISNGILNVKVVNIK